MDDRFTMTDDEAIEDAKEDGKFSEAARFAERRSFGPMTALREEIHSLDQVMGEAQVPPPVRIAR